MNLDLDTLKKNFHLLTPDEKLMALDALETRDKQERITLAHDDFLAYVKEVWPDFIGGPHHRIMADKFNEVKAGKCKRLIINMPPRHTKSEFASNLLISWLLGHFPKKKIIQCANKQELAAKFGRDVRDMIAEDEKYHELFPQTELRADNKAANRWTTRQKGEYFAIGVDGKVTGRGADYLIIDDPHDEQEARSGDPKVYDTVFDWYQAGPRQRLQPNAAIIIVQTRWSKRDLTGRLLKHAAQDPDSDQWDHITLPAIIDENGPNERAMWPQYWSLTELKKTRASIVDVKLWQGPYQQEPTSQEGAILKKDYWKTWLLDKPPPCHFIIQSLDTAMTKQERSDYSAWTTWGIFSNRVIDEETGDENTVDCAILLDAHREKCDYPGLKKRAKEFYDDHLPDILLIEAKNTGTALIQELSNAGLPIEDFTPVRGSKRIPNDKVARANLVTSLFTSGRVYAPDTRWANEVIEECNDFDSGEHDDYVDSTVQAMFRLRAGGLIRPDTDQQDDGFTDARNVKSRRRRRYY